MGASLEEQVVWEHGDLCTVKDCCVVICDGPRPVENPPRKFADTAKLHAAYEAVRSSTEKIYGRREAERVYSVLLRLPVRYNARLTRAIGRVKFRNVNGNIIALVIELTAAYEIPESYLHRLLVHEACHVACAVIDPIWFLWDKPHGDTWRNLMKWAGVEPDAMCTDPEIVAQRRKRLGHPEAGLMTRESVNVGDRVSFMGGKKRGRVTGSVVQKTEKVAMIKDDSGGSWRVSYGRLTKEQP